MLHGCGLTRTKIALVIKVHAVRSCLEIVSCRKSLHHRKQLILAVKTPRGVIADVLRAGEFRSGNDLKRNSLLARENHGIVQLEAGKAWRICNDRQHVVAERLMRSPGEKGRISTDGI